MITLSEELDRAKELESIGDVAYVSSLLDGVPDRPSIEHYVKIVRDKAMLRGLIHAANAAISRAADQMTPPKTFSAIPKPLSSSSPNSASDAASWACRRSLRRSSARSTPSLQRGQRITGIATHYADLDEMTSGLQRSDLIIIAARPSMGKTAFAMNIAENAAINDQKIVAVFSLEMSSEALLQRMLCSRREWTPTNIRTGSLWQDDTRKIAQAMEKLTHAPIFIDDTPGISLSEMRAKSRRLQAVARPAGPDHRRLPAANVSRRPPL